jgi:hypothetical protein
MGIASCTCATGSSSTALPSTDMRRLWQGLLRTLFWSYDRGSWPYDVMVIAVAAFVLLTPRHWFHDQPQSVALATSDVQLVSEDSPHQTSTYRLAAKVLPVSKRTAKPTPELERETHDILGRAVEELKGQTFQVSRIDPMRAEDGSVVYYDVTVRP